MADALTLKSLTHADLLEVARIHCAAFPASALTALGVEAVRRYYAWQLDGPHEVSAYAALRETQLVGFYFGGLFRGALSGFLANERRYLAWRLATHPWLMLNPLFRERLQTGWRALRKKWRSAPASTSAPKTAPPRQFGILAIAVHPATQGLGAGQLLMNHAESQARAQHYTEMQLSVLTDNQQAIRFYERLGWQRTFEGDTWKGNMIKTLN